MKILNIWLRNVTPDIVDTAKVAMFEDFTVYNKLQNHLLYRSCSAS